jgi:hypothetical protein
MSATVSQTGAYKLICVACSHDCEPGAKYCSNCGLLIDSRHLAGYVQEQVTEQLPLAVPNFAPVSPRHVRAPSEDLRAEAGKLMLLLARERLFLYMHWLIFLGINLIGFWIAHKCYTEYLGDDLTRIMMGSTPILYINSTALICIVPIRGTRKEIARLKEKLNYLKFQIEYGHLL